MTMISHYYINCMTVYTAFHALIVIMFEIGSTLSARQNNYYTSIVNNIIVGHCLETKI